MEFVWNDHFKYALNPPELAKEWGNIDSYIYVIEKEFKVDETSDAPPLHLIKIGMSRDSRGPARLLDARTYLVSLLVPRTYLFEPYHFDG